MGPSAADGELKRKIEEYKAREDIYVAGLIGQEAELNQLRQMASDVLAAYGDLSRAAVRNALVDPASNMEVLLLRQRAREKDQQISQLREEAEANRFDQRNPAGQALMRKCKALLVENRELGEEIREERLSELSAAVVAEQRLNAALLQKSKEAMEFCTELSQENEKLQGTIAKVAGRLREARDELEVLRKERAEAKARRKKEREQQKKVATAGDPQMAPEEPQSSEGLGMTTLTIPTSGPTITVPASPEAAVQAAASGGPAPVSDVVIAAGALEGTGAGEPVEKEKKEKKKRKTEGGEEHVKDKKEKKRRKAEKASAASAAPGAGQGSASEVPGNAADQSP